MRTFTINYNDIFLLSIQNVIFQSKAIYKEQLFVTSIQIKTPTPLLKKLTTLVASSTVITRTHLENEM